MREKSLNNIKQELIISWRKFDSDVKCWDEGGSWKKDLK